MITSIFSGQFNHLLPDLYCKQDAPLMALHGMLNVAPIIPHCMFRRYFKKYPPLAIEIIVWMVLFRYIAWYLSLCY